MKWSKCRGIATSAMRAGIRYKGPNFREQKANCRKGCRRVPGVSFNCRNGQHLRCTKLACSCTCGHFVT